MLILGLLGMYFDAAVVFVTKSSLFSDWLWPYCVVENSKLLLSGMVRSGIHHMFSGQHLSIDAKGQEF